jgi:hypothetical protein
MNSSDYGNFSPQAFYRISGGKARIMRSSLGSGLEACLDEGIEADQPGSVILKTAIQVRAMPASVGNKNRLPGVLRQILPDAAFIQKIMT